MARGPKALQTALAHAHAELDADSLNTAFYAARRALPAAEVYDLFSGYLAPAGRAKKGKGGDAAKQMAVIDALGGDHIYNWSYHREIDSYPLDPRWLDLAVRLKHLRLVHAVGRPGHAGAEALLQEEFDAAVKKPRSQDQLRDVVAVMVRLRHPNAADALIAACEKSIGKANDHSYWYRGLIPQLPKSAVPGLEAVVPRLKDREADQWLAAVQELRDKTATPTPE
jgi:hypothetical protein